MTESKNTTRILYIEDEEGLAFLLTRRLSRHGYTVDIAPNATLGFEMLDTNEYDILLVDYKLPNQSGLDVIELVSKQIDAPPTIMVTGAGNERIAVEAIKHGASDYVVKDTGRVYLEVLPSKIDRAVEQHRLKQSTRHAQEALRENEERLRSTVESLDDIVLLINPEYKFTDYYLPKRDVVSMIPIEKFVGKKLDDVLPNNISDLFYDAISKVQQTGDVQNFDYELLIDGSLYWFSVKISQRVDAQHQYAGVTVVVRDITNRKNTEQVLQQSEERFRQLFEHAPNGMLIVSPEGNIRHVNLAFRDMLDFRLEQLWDQPLHAFVHPNEQSNVVFSEIYETNKTSSTIVRFLRSDRRIVHAEIQATHLNFESSHSDYFLVQISDITERKIAEGRLYRYINLIEIIQEIDDEMHRATQTDEIFDIALNTIHAIGGSDCTYIVAPTSSSDILSIVATINVPDNLLNTILPDSNISYSVAKSLVPEWIDEPNETTVTPLLATSSIMVGIPMSVEDRLLGVVVLESSRISQFNIDIFEQLKILTSRVRIALHTCLMSQVSSEK